MKIKTSPYDFSDSMGKEKEEFFFLHFRISDISEYNRNRSVKAIKKHFPYLLNSNDNDVIYNYLLNEPFYARGDIPLHNVIISQIMKNKNVILCHFRELIENNNRELEILTDTEILYAVTEVFFSQYFSCGLFDEFILNILEDKFTVYTVDGEIMDDVIRTGYDKLGNFYKIKSSF
jgi:hypothetical protein